jgi:hypothetical protein
MEINTQAAKKKLSDFGLWASIGQPVRVEVKTKDFGKKENEMNKDQIWKDRADIQRQIISIWEYFYPLPMQQV